MTFICRASKCHPYYNFKSSERSTGKIYYILHNYFFNKKFLLGLHCTEASPVSGLGHSQTSVRKGKVFATRHMACSPQDVTAHGFLQLPCKHARSGPQSASLSHSACSITEKIFYLLPNIPLFTEFNFKQIFHKPGWHSILGFPCVPRGHSHIGKCRATVQCAPCAHAPGHGFWQTPLLQANQEGQSSSTVHSFRLQPVHGLPRAPGSHSQDAVCPRATQ